MSIFEDGQAEISLSDEALFGEPVAAEEVTEERQEEPPQTETAEESPAEEQTSEETVVEEEVTEPTKPQAEINPELEQLRKQYAEARAEMTRKQMEAAEERKQRQKLETALAQATSNDPQAREKFLETFMQNPQEALRQVTNTAAEKMVTDKVKELLNPIIEATQQKQQEQSWNEAWLKTAETWPDIGKNGQALVEKMTEISAEYGDSKLMFKQPKRFMQMAAMELMGIPKVADEKALQATAKAAREETMKEISTKNAAKTGLAVTQQTKPINETALSPEEKIVREIMEAGSKGIFG